MHFGRKDRVNSPHVNEKGPSDSSIGVEDMAILCDIKTREAEVHNANAQSFLLF